MFFAHVWHLDTPERAEQNPDFHYINSGKHLMPVNQSELGSLRLCSHSFPGMFELAIILQFSSKNSQLERTERAAAQIPLHALILHLYSIKAAEIP